MFNEFKTTLVTKGIPGHKFSDEALKDMAEKFKICPLTWNFVSETPMGHVDCVEYANGEVSISGKIFTEQDEIIKKILEIEQEHTIEYRTMLRITSSHKEGDVTVIDKATLLEVSIVLVSTGKKY